MFPGKTHSNYAPANLVVVMALLLAASRPLAADEFAAPLPAGVTAVWDLDKSYRETTPTRERICLNGLWRWQPAQADPGKTEPPKANWGYFKVPGCWPGISDYLQKDCSNALPAFELERCTPGIREISMVRARVPRAGLLGPPPNCADG